MMGIQCGAQEWLSYSFNLEDHVPKDHLLRGVDRVLDLREHLASFYSHTGRPSIHPELMIVDVEPVPLRNTLRACHLLAPDIRSWNTANRLKPLSEIW